MRLYKMEIFDWLKSMKSAPPSCSSLKHMIGLSFQLYPTTRLSFESIWLAIRVDVCSTIAQFRNYSAAHICTVNFFRGPPPRLSPCPACLSLLILLILLILLCSTSSTYTTTTSHTLESQSSSWWLKASKRGRQAVFWYWYWQWHHLHSKHPIIFQQNDVALPSLGLILRSLKEVKVHTPSRHLCKPLCATIEKSSRFH